jgi:hypothetical protein
MPRSKSDVARRSWGTQIANHCRIADGNCQGVEGLLHTRDKVLGFLKNRTQQQDIGAWRILDPVTGIPLSFRIENVNMVWLRKIDPARLFTEDNTEICTFRNTPGVVPPATLRKRPSPPQVHHSQPLAKLPKELGAHEQSLNEVDDVLRLLPELLQTANIQEYNIDPQRILALLEKQLVDFMCHHRTLRGCNGKFYKLPLRGPCRATFLFCPGEIADASQARVQDFYIKAAYRNPVYQGSGYADFSDGLDAEANPGVFAQLNGLEMLQKFEVPAPHDRLGEICTTHGDHILPATADTPAGCLTSLLYYKSDLVECTDGVRRPYFYKHWFEIAGDNIMPPF